MVCRNETQTFAGYNQIPALYSTIVMLSSQAHLFQECRKPWVMA